MTSGHLKAGWRIVKFGDIAENIAVRVSPAAADTDVYVGLEHLEPETLHLRRWGHPSDVEGDKLRFRKGDVIFARRRAYQRKLALAEFDGICSAHAMVIRAKPKMILPEFLPFFLQSDMFMERAIEISVGSLSPTINWKTLRVQEFPLPPIEEQERIAEILWAADEVVEEYLRAQEFLSSLKRQQFRGILAKSHAVPVACSKLYSKAPRNGYSPRPNAAGKGAPTLSVGAVRNGRVIPEGNIKYAEISSTDLDNFRLVPGDILVVRGNGNKSLCGKAGMVSCVPQNCFYPDLLIRITFDENKILPEFAVEQWNDPVTHKGLLAYAKSTNGIWKINGKDVRQHKLLVPPLEAQERIVNQLTDFKEREERLSLHRQKAGVLKAILANRLIEGNGHV